MSGTHKYTKGKKRNWYSWSPFLRLKQKPVFNLKGHQSSGARAPGLWCPHNSFSVFLVVYPQLCWQYSDKTRKLQEHINTLGKNTNWYSWWPFLSLQYDTSCQLERAPEFWCPGTRTLVPPQFVWCFLGCVSSMLLAVFGYNQETPRTHKYAWYKRQIDISDVHSRDYNKKPS